MEKVKYFLVLEKRLGDYNYIDISKLDIFNDIVSTDIEYIDTFTSRFTENELRDAIIRSNMVEVSYLSGNLKIVSDAKHNLRVVTKEVFEEVINIMHGVKEIDQDLKNKIYSLFKNVVEKNFNDVSFIKELLDKFKDALKNNDLNNIFRYIGLLPYQKIRPVYFMIYDELKKREDINIKRLEKLNEVE